jgi:hypothetical protein
VLVLLPLHKPIEIAEQLATLDIMCDGKLVFGCGIGYRDAEFNAFGVTRKEAARRFEECLLAVKRLWKGFVDMTGSHFVLDHANSTVKPLQKPMPPIWIGANKRRSKTAATVSTSRDALSAAARSAISTRHSLRKARCRGAHGRLSVADKARTHSSTARRRR